MTHDKILLIDRDPGSLTRVSAWLKRDGFAVVTTESEETALVAMDREAPDIAVAFEPTDTLDGLSLLEALCRVRPEVPVVMVADGDSERTIAYLQLGASDVLPRPLTKAGLAVALERAIERIETNGFRGLTETFDVDPKKEVAELLDAERFIAVNQVLDNISLFIERISTEVEGGVKYLDRMPYFVSIHDRHLKIVSTNMAYRKLLGNKVGKDSWEIYTEKWGGKESCPVGQTLKSEQVQQFRAEVRYRNGLRVPVIVHTAPIYNNNGEVELVLEVSAGTPDVNRLKEELKTTQQRYQQLFDAVPCFISVLNRDLRITAVNRRFSEEFGENTGARFFEVFDLTPGSSGDPISQVFADGRPHEAEMALVQGHRRYNALVWTAPIQTAAGKLLQILVMFVDITQIRQLRDNLSSLGLMLGSIAHGIKGILTGLNAGLYLITSGRSQAREKKVEEGIEMSREMIERIERVVFDILYYAKRRTLDWKRTDLLRFANDIAATFGPRLDADKVEFVIDFRVHDEDFETDATLLRSALINILENALDACLQDPSGRSHRLEFTLRVEEDLVLFDISDNGIGMDADARRKMFDLFFSTKGTRGTGLGMFITDKIVRQHGGLIEVTSVPGEGTRFAITLPRRLPDAVKQNRIDPLLDFEFTR
jgi:signal transduction histidine kinase/DNA-binding response OmpR family regulator